MKYKEVFKLLCILVSASGVPAGFNIQAIQGFVEELVVNEDPDYQWIDKIRSMRASNEARQVAFSKLSGEAMKIPYSEFLSIKWRLLTLKVLVTTVDALGHF